MPQLTAQLAPAFAERALALWSWWLGELAAMVPDGVHRLRKSVPQANIRPLRDGVFIDLEKGGVGERLREDRPLADLDEDGWSELAAVVAGARCRIVLSPPDAFVLKLILPAAARGRLRGAVAIQLRHAAPVAVEALAWNCRVVADDGRQLIVLVAMARAATIAAIAADFGAAGLPPPPVHAGAGDTDLKLAAGSDFSLTPERRRTRQALSVAVALIASVPLTTWAVAGALTWTAESRAETLHEELAPRLAEDRARAREERARRALHAVYARPGAAPLLERLALALPENAYAVSAEQRGDGRFVAVVETSDREGLEHALRESAEFDARPVNAAPAHEGRVRLTFEARPR